MRIQVFQQFSLKFKNNQPKFLYCAYFYFNVSSICTSYLLLNVRFTSTSPTIFNSQTTMISQHHQANQQQSDLKTQQLKPKSPMEQKFAITQVDKVKCQSRITEVQKNQPQNQVHMCDFLGSQTKNEQNKIKQKSDLTNYHSQDQLNQQKQVKNHLSNDQYINQKPQITRNDKFKNQTHIEKQISFGQGNSVKQQLNPTQHVNYITPLQAGLNQMHKYMFAHQQNVSSALTPNLSIQMQAQLTNSVQLQNHPRRKWYLNPQDWQADKKKGGFFFINEDKKKNQTKVVKFVVKKFLSSGSFMGISFPTFAMKPESILESYAKALGAAPNLLENIKNPVERMKKFVCLIHTFSALFADMDKPFNPTLGQTYQAVIAKGSFSAEQICHHPPISAFMFSGNGYTISGSMELTASIGANSAKGLFVGDLNLSFEDGSILKGKIPGGQFSGFMIGQNRFQTLGSVYAYDNKKLVCSFSTPKRNNYFEGYIGKLKSKYQQEFFSKVKTAQRFQKFPFYQRKCFDTVYSFMQMAYNSSTSFDGKQYINLFQQKFLPFLPQQIPNKGLLLKSDSSFRKDIPLRKQLKLQESQNVKQSIQDEERLFRRLREKYDTSHHKAP